MTSPRETAEGRPWRRRGLVALVVTLSAVSCTGTETPLEPDGPVCTAQFVFGLTVTVEDEAASRRICDADVVAIDGSYRETLRPFGPPEGCTYAGAGERPGTYEVRVTRAGFSPAALADVRVAADECHVVPAKVTIELSR